jgi:nucleoside-diphosphate-sugar epimerase
MKVIVLGAGGFIGAQVAASLSKSGHDVVAIDSFNKTLYSAGSKKQRVSHLLETTSAEFFEADLIRYPLVEILRGSNVIVNEAALPGLSPSWEYFHEYQKSNLELVQRVLDAMASNPHIHLVQASTSSVYGSSAVGGEDLPLAPVSPYGVTKLAAEYLIGAYRSEKSVSASILRYFSVYGPNQRPDMGISKFCTKLLEGEDIEIFGDGNQTRSGTYIDDVVTATVLAAEKQLDGAVMNISGSDSLSVRQIINVLADELGVEPNLRYTDPRPGDQLATMGDSTLASRLLGWQPQMKFEEGLRIQAREARSAWLKGKNVD